MISITISRCQMEICYRTEKVLQLRHIREKKISCVANVFKILRYVRKHTIFVSLPVFVFSPVKVEAFERQFKGCMNG